MVAVFRPVPRGVGAAVATILVIAAASSGAPVLADPVAPAGCAPESPTYTFTNVAVSIRPTNLYSAYVTGPATITYNQTTTATASASMTATVSAEAGVVFAKASTSIGVTVGASYSSSGGFSYSFPVPSGQRRKIQLYQSSRAFTVTKRTFNTGQCRWVTAYSAATNAPKVQRDDEWRLVA